MRRKPRETERQLRARILEGMVRDIGISERMAQPFVDSVMSCFAGERVYFPATDRKYPLLHIRAALERGVPAKRVLTEFELSRRTLHRLFPGGLPKCEKAANDD